MAIALAGCSLSLENPELDARKKVAKPIPTTMSALVGRWNADSTYTVDDTRAFINREMGVWLEIFADTSYSQVDTSRITFNGKSDGVYVLTGDTLITFPDASAPDTFLVKITFMGNYLEILHPADQRYTFFHKIKPQDSATQIAMLKDSLWRMQGHRLDPGIFRAESFVKDFSYLRFSGDSMYADVRTNGVIRRDSGLLSKAGFTWTWKATSGTKGFLADLIHADSLRIWPLTEGRPDSGYYLYLRTTFHHERDVDTRPMLGHMRCDSVRNAAGLVENHYGRYYDWTFGEDHKVTVETNMVGVPLFDAWTLDSGFVSLDAPGRPRLRMRLDSAGGRVAWLPQDSSTFGKNVILYQTKVDPARFRTRPLERFEQASYLELVISGDTTDYFFNVNHIKDKDQFEIASIVSDSVYWASITLNKAQETFQSSQPGFYFAFEGRNKALGRFLCRSRPGKDLVIRQTASSDPILAQGLVQGTFEIIRADSAIADSNLVVEGSFRLKRKTYGNLKSSAWGIP